MNKYDLIAVGGGPAGLGAVITAAQHGASCLLIDENTKPGGQLFKQIHKFFGSGGHFAGVRGYEIGRRLLQKAEELKVDIMLGTTVWGVFPDNIVAAYDREQKAIGIRGGAVVLATGARENFLSFPGNGLPGVMTAGAAQTMTNLYGVLPGKRIVVVGSGNVGLIVSYQLLQAGAQVACIVEAASKVSGYLVHAGKVKRAGVPILLNHTVKRAEGNSSVEKVVLCQVDEHFNPLDGTEREIEADTLCIAVGLSPRSELSGLCGCEMGYDSRLGGSLPLHDANMATSADGIFVAGDLAGIEEASTALEEGRLAGVSALIRMGGFDNDALHSEGRDIRERLAALRQGPFGQRIREAKQEIYNFYNVIIKDGEKP